MTRLLSRRPAATVRTCTGYRWTCPAPDCTTYADTAWARVGARIQQWRHQRSHDSRKAQQ